MDLTSAVGNFQQARVAAAIQTKVARKILDAQQLQGAAVVKLIEAAGATAAKAGDTLAAVATGLGGQIDLFA